MRSLSAVIFNYVFKWGLKTSPFTENLLFVIQEIVVAQDCFEK